MQAGSHIVGTAGAAPAALQAGLPTAACLLGGTTWLVAGGALLGQLRSAASPAPCALRASPADSSSYLHTLPLLRSLHRPP